MKLATIRSGAGIGDREARAGTVAVRIDGDVAVELPAADVGEVLGRDGWQAWAAAADGPRHAVADLDYAPLVPRPDKVICVGLNYRSHIEETGRDVPTHPTLFAKFRGALVGARDDIVVPFAAEQVDWEAELAVVVGARARHVAVDDAPAFIAGYTILNDVSMRDWQNRTVEWLQGKTWERSTPVGPWLVTRDESPGPSREITCEVDGELMQKADTADLVFDPATLVSYISTVITLEPGDIIATGTPSGVGMGRGRWLGDGDVVVTRIAGLGELRNVCRAEPHP
ncbi:MAG TPA: fumarylacetoacetate hydrolase family protein [Acidimicrobiales bacterium]|nr:fumarylacetoacetate hydrolase family protein [Acidimicrobiales bacterium]